MCSCTHSIASVVVFLSCFIWSLFKNIHRWLKTVGIEQPQKLSFSAPTISLPYSQPRSFQKYISLFGCLRKPFFLISVSLTLFLAFFQKGDHQRFLGKTLLAHSCCLFRFSHFLASFASPHTIYTCLHIFLEIQNYSPRSSERPSLLATAGIRRLCWGWGGVSVRCILSCYIIMMIRILTTI